MARVISNKELLNNGAVYTFEGYVYGGVDVLFYLSETAPGKGPGLHKHPYDEVFVVQEGELTFPVVTSPSKPRRLPSQERLAGFRR
jgi:quercetin dioxygenase-like cupin family protein